MRRFLGYSARSILLFFASLPPIFAQPTATTATPPSTPSAWPTAQEVGPAPGMEHLRPGIGLVLKEGSLLRIQGATTQRSFELWAGSLLGSVVLEAPLRAELADPLLNAVRKQGVLAMTLAVPIVLLHASDSEVERGSDYALAGPYKTLHGKETPNVEFRLSETKLGKKIRPGVYSIQATGELSIAGVSQDILLKGEAAFSGDQVRVTGHYKIHLAVFKVRVFQDVWGSMGPNPTVDVSYNLIFGPVPAP